MRSNLNARLGGMFMAAALWLAGASCSSSDQPGTPSATSNPTMAATPPISPNASPHEAHPIVAESSEWSADEALANLSDARLGVSAAVRLARLAEVRGPYSPTRLDREFAKKLRLVSLGDEYFALGVADSASERRLHDVLVIDSAGKVTRVNEGRRAGPSEGGGDYEPAAAADADDVAESAPKEPKRESSNDNGGPYVLHVSRDGEVFPHVFIGAMKVFLAPQIGEPALTLEFPDALRFELKEESLHSYLALILHAEGGGAVEVARYNWDPFEAMFQGPAADKLPDPPGGRFEMDMDACGRLQPVGGEIPDPDPVKPELPERKEPS